jgi:hypothetical protein
MSNGDRPKKSWRELDAQRDRSGARTRDEREARDRLGLPAQRTSKQYRAALEALFDKGGVSKLAEKIEERTGPAPGTRPTPQGKKVEAPAADEGKVALRRKIVEAIGRDEITRATDRYLKEHPLPDDFEVLEQVIEHRKPERIEQALAAIERLLDGGDKPKRTRILSAKLRHLEETADDKEVRATAAKLRARLG